MVFNRILNWFTDHVSYSFLSFFNDIWSSPAMNVSCNSLAHWFYWKNYLIVKTFFVFFIFLAINCKHKSGSIFFSKIEFLRHFQPASVIELDLKMKIMILFESFGLLFIVYDNVAFLSQCRSLVFSFIERTLYRTSHRKWVAGESSHLATDKHWLVWEKKLTADDGNFLISSQSIKSEI